ncbi:MAG: PAS domain S-box protein [Desulfotignum sp.]|nr:PAS domain S-box protein [Desulfotignum sp.]
MDGFWIVDTAGRFLEVNETYCEMSGYSEEELLHMDISAVEDVEAPVDVGAHMQKVLAEGQDRFESRHRRKDGTVFDVEVSVQKRPLDEPQCVVFIRDITERKCAELDLLESETRFKALHNASFGGIVIHDQGVILECNQGLSEMMGYEYSELIGMDGLLLIAEQSREKVKNNIRTGYEKPYEAFGLRKNGEEFPMHLEARNVPYKGKKVRTVEFRDLTEQKQAETEKEKLQAQLSQAQKMESVGRLAGGVAHDFNNMLGVILGHSEMALLKADENHELHDDLKEIQKAAKRSADITKQLLAFARKQTISPEQLDLNDTVESMLNMLRRLIGEDIDLIWQPASDLWPVKMDPSQIDQILANLCVNARDAIAGVGKLTIETGRKTFDEEYCSDHPGCTPGDFVLLAVSDNGCGMDKDTLDNLFEPFFTTKEVGKGTGLGLATIYGIVKQNNGFINVYNEPGQGSMFKIYLPRLVVDEDLDKAMPEKKAVVGGTETILLVEDEPSILRMTRMMLEKKGYTVLSAATPGEAMEKAKNNSGTIDLLMTDVVMPEMNGRDLAGKITVLHPGTRLLFMSGYTANVIAHHGVLDAGVAFIQKPFSMADLMSKVRDVLNKESDETHV